MYKSEETREYSFHSVITFKGIFPFFNDKVWAKALKILNIDSPNGFSWLTIFNFTEIRMD